MYMDNVASVQAGGGGNMRCKPRELIKNCILIAQKKYELHHIPLVSFVPIVGIPSIFF
jgi:hypothetical protein